MYNCLAITLLLPNLVPIINTKECYMFRRNDTQVQYKTNLMSLASLYLHMLDMICSRPLHTETCVAAASLSRRIVLPTPLMQAIRSCSPVSHKVFHTIIPTSCYNGLVATLLQCKNIVHKAALQHVYNVLQ